VLKELFQKRHQVYAWPFYQPVDVEGLKLHDYNDVIKKAMDLSTVQKNMDEGVYQAKEEFSADVLRIFENCNIVSTKTFGQLIQFKNLRGWVSLFCTFK
jgi:hypothetical protein